MKAVGLLVLLIIVCGVFTPHVAFPAQAKPEKAPDGHKINASSKETVITKHNGKSILKVTPTATSSNIRVSVESRENEVEYTWILSSKPDTNKFTLKLDLPPDAVATYQPPLNAEIRDTALWGKVNATHAYDKKGILLEYRPLNVVGSYAIYSSNRNGDYQTGKITHIYRPLVWDATGAETWGTLSIEGNILTVTVSQLWLNNAVYPVTVDPTFGYTLTGASIQAITADYAYAIEVTTPTDSAMFMDSITIYGASDGGNRHFKGAYWLANVLKDVTAESVDHAPIGGGSLSAIVATRGSYIPSNSLIYLGLLMTDNTCDIYYDDGAIVSHIDNTNSYATPNSFSASADGTRSYSVYLTYLDLGGTTVNLDDTDNIYAKKKYYTFTTTITDTAGANTITDISVSGKQGANVRFLVTISDLEETSLRFELTTGEGVINLGGPLTLKGYSWDDGGVITADLTDVNDIGANDVTFLPSTPAVNDAIYFGGQDTFSDLRIDIGTQGVGTWTFAWEYWNGATWVAVSGLTDGTTGFTATTGIKDVTFTKPTDWALKTVSAVSAYWVRARVATYSAKTTIPIGTQAWIVMTDASSTWTEDGNTGTLVTMIELEWDAVNEEDCELVTVVTGTTMSYTETKTDYYDPISRLVTTGPYASQPNIPLGQDLTISGVIYYATTSTGNTPSSSYPPNAQFTGVQVWDQFNVVWGTDASIASGAYSVTFNTTDASTASTFYPYVDMLPDYTDALTADSRSVTVYIQSFYAGDLLSIIGDLLGITTFTTPITDALTSLGGYFSTSLSRAIQLMVQMITIVGFMFGSIIYWMTLVIGTVISVVTTIGSILNGSLFATSIGLPVSDIWAYIGFGTWAPLLVLILLIMWWDGLTPRAKRSGQNVYQVMIGDFQTAMYLVDLSYAWMMNIFNLVYGVVTWFAGIVAGGI